jgi:excisionase family DNA binding protein
MRPGGAVSSISGSAARELRRPCEDQLHHPIDEHSARAPDAFSSPMGASVRGGSRRQPRGDLAVSRADRARRDRPPARLLTVDEVAEILNVSSAYVRRRLVFERRLPYVKVGRHLRIDERDLRVFIEAGRVSATRYKGARGTDTRKGTTWPP